MLELPMSVDSDRNNAIFMVTNGYALCRDGRSRLETPR